MRRIVLTALLGIVLPASAAVVLAGDEKKAASDAERAAIERLVQQLGADDFRTREEASRKLAGYGTKARDVLREAARTSQSPEVRWRAEQLLRRMDGAGERPLGAGPGTAPEGEAPASGELDSLMEQVRKQMEAFLQRKPRGGLLESLMEGDKIEAPGLVLERSFARGSKLLVKRKTEAGEEVTDTFTGLGLADILRRHPELAKHPGMAELQRKVAERAW
nr:HEAT repeat domain-containing protein [Planctomycetota bacterium]